MRICVKCGEKIPDNEAIEWDYCNGTRYICPECKLEEEDYYDEEEDN